MAKKEELFWTGIGVKTIDGKDYGAGMPLPVDKIDPDDLKKMKKDGRIGKMIAIVADGCKDCTGHLDTIEAKNSLLKEKEMRIVELSSETERLEGEVKESAELKAAHAQKHIDNPVIPDTELAEELATEKADNEEKAALIEKQKAKIKELKK